MVGSRFRIPLSVYVVAEILEPSELHDKFSAVRGGMTEGGGVTKGRDGVTEGTASGRDAGVTGCTEGRDRGGDVVRWGRVWVNGGGDEVSESGDELCCSRLGDSGVGSTLALEEAEASKFIEPEGNEMVDVDADADAVGIKGLGT